MSVAAWIREHHGTHGNGTHQPAVPREQSLERATRHAINEFTAGVMIMAEYDEGKADIGALVDNLVVALQKQTRNKLHPIMYVNLGLLLSITFASGVMWQRVNTLEDKIHNMQNTDTISVQVKTLSDEVYQLRDRLDRFLDSQIGKTGK